MLSVLLGDFSKFQHLWPVKEHASISPRDDPTLVHWERACGRALVGSLQVPWGLKDGWRPTSSPRTNLDPFIISRILNFFFSLRRERG